MCLDVFYTYHIYPRFIANKSKVPVFFISGSDLAGTQCFDQFWAVRKTEEIAGQTNQRAWNPLQPHFLPLYPIPLDTLILSTTKRQHKAKRIPQSSFRSAWPKLEHSLRGRRKRRRQRPKVQFTKDEKPYGTIADP